MFDDDNIPSVRDDNYEEDDIEFYGLNGVVVEDNKYNNEFNLGKAKKVFINGEERNHISEDKIEGVEFDANMGRGKVVLEGYDEEGDKIEFVF